MTANDCIDIGNGAAVLSGSRPDREDQADKRRRPEPTPAQRVLGLLARREHSSKELARKLTARGIPAEEADTTVAHMAAEGWQDDGRFAMSLARMRANTGYGPVRIRAELGMHGLDSLLIDQAFASLAETGDDDWTGRARVLIRRRYGEGVGSDLARQRKAAVFLQRRGFDSETIRIACRGGADDG